MTGTTVSDAVDALVALWTGVAPTGWMVLDSGPPVDPPQNFLCVGFDHSGEPAISVGADIADAAMESDEETYEVSSLLSLWQGSSSNDVDTSPKSVRDAVIAAFTVFRDALRANHTLGGKVGRARVVDWELDQDLSALGDIASIRFTTRINAWK